MPSSRKSSLMRAPSKKVSALWVKNSLVANVTTATRAQLRAARSSATTAAACASSCSVWAFSASSSAAVSGQFRICSRAQLVGQSVSSQSKMITASLLDLEKLRLVPGDQGLLPSAEGPVPPEFVPTLSTARLRLSAVLLAVLLVLRLFDRFSVLGISSGKPGSDSSGRTSCHALVLLPLDEPLLRLRAAEPREPLLRLRTCSCMAEAVRKLAAFRGSW
mmetsp:Transcript_114217/g.271884  ORF Transcript_114217/g.271884 Transcript_114217/m.271884 type:complete len:219 (+) Transcript_114217:483-1139(+)